MAPGTRCASILLALDLPVDLVVRTVMEEMHLMHDEAVARVDPGVAKLRSG